MKKVLKNKAKIFWNQRYLMLLTLPAVIWMIIFNYTPMMGIIIAFKDFNPASGFMNSPWVGLEHFKDLFSDPTFPTVLYNTIKISFARIIFGFPAPIIFALLLNELVFKRFKKIVQTLSYLPYFISWVLVVGFMYSLFDTQTGIIGSLLVKLGWIDNYALLMGNPKYFLSLVVLSDIWKNLGWNSIIYLAAIAGIDPNLYEAAIIDGAGRFRRIWHITLPAIKPTIVILLILNISGLFNANFQQLYMMQNSLTQDVANVINIYSYRMGLVLGRYSYGTAVGFFQSVVSVILLVLANFLSRKFTNESLF